MILFESRAEKCIFAAKSRAEKCQHSVKTRAEKCHIWAKTRAEKCQWQVLTDCIIENYQIFAFCEEFKRMQVIEN